MPRKSNKTATEMLENLEQVQVQEAVQVAPVLDKLWKEVFLALLPGADLVRADSEMVQHRLKRCSDLTDTVIKHMNGDKA